MANQTTKMLKSSRVSPQLLVHQSEAGELSRSQMIVVHECFESKNRLEGFAKWQNSGRKFLEDVIAEKGADSGLDFHRVHCCGILTAT